MFLNRPVLIAGDPRHSAREVRYYAFGFTDQTRQLTMDFTQRGPWVRLESAGRAVSGEAGQSVGGYHPQEPQPRLDAPSPHPKQSCRLKLDLQELGDSLAVFKPFGPQR